MDWDKEQLEKELEAVRGQAKERRLEYYFEHIAMLYEEDLDLTEEDVRAYQQQREAQVSMKPTKKRDAVVRQAVRPLLKAGGFKSVRNSWWKELEDGWLFIYMKNSQWNSMATGATFEFDISVSGRDEIRGELSEQWIHNQLNCLCQSDFLPYCGYLRPRMGVREYRIDGYRNYLPMDDPLEEIVEQIRADFEDCILPALDRIRTKADWEILYGEKRAARDTEDMRLLRYYSSAHMLSCAESNMRGLIETQRQFGLTPEKILSHFDWLEILIQNSSQTFRDTKAYILETLEMQKK